MKKVEIFALKNDLSQNECGCTCDCSGVGDTILITDLIADFTKVHVGIATFNLKLWNGANDEGFLETINQLLKVNGERLTVASNNQVFVWPKILPMMVVDNKILSINDIPECEQWLEVISLGKKLEKKSGCC
ncbi:hypothetical protein [Carboxylicivirga marina]|uniref:STAS/SEC14 domain-containing protein n=1 Tax=Carboxylicivirga marina TaxID=2800988 RepID=A0ABS1HNA3_9BACT|nr:hypothetical protein [Carboxylicivirga marina]MBK3519022.1 hypothetical protein [Carboxylicivirga marina]